MQIPQTSSGSMLRRGFTLLEIMIVIALLAILGTFGWQARKMIKTRQMNETAKLQIAQMATGMNAYRQDAGDVLPGGEGDDWSSHVLYSILYCDADDDGQPDVDPKTGETRIPYCEALTIVLKGDKEISNGIPVRRMSIVKPGKKGERVKRRVIIDPWGKPYRYRLGYEIRDAERNRFGKGVNPDFDIFSMGPDGQGNGLTNHGDNEDNISNILTWD